MTTSGCVQYKGAITVCIRLSMLLNGTDACLRIPGESPRHAIYALFFCIPLISSWLSVCIKMCCTCGVCIHVLHLRKFTEPPSCLVQTQVSPQCRAGLASPLPGRQPNGGRNGHAPPNIPVNMHQALLLKRQASPRWILLRGSFAMLFCPSTLWAAYLPRMWRHCHSGLIAAAFLTSAISPSTRHRLGSKKCFTESISGY